MKINQKGITIIQALILAGTIGLVVLVFTILLSNERQKTRDNIRVANIKQIQAGLELFYSQNGSYPSTATGPTQGASGHNWLPNMQDQGVQSSFAEFISQDLIAPSPADSSVCRSTKSCNGDNVTQANDFCYTASPQDCSAFGEIKCDDFLLDFCLGKSVGSLSSGNHSINRDGIK